MEASQAEPQLPATTPDFERLVLFDGVCAVCDRTVQWILDHDPDNLFHFSPLQGETARAVFERHPEVPDDLDTIFFVRRSPDGTETLSWFSTALLDIAGELPAPWRYLTAFRVVPRVVRDPFYKGFAAVRYKVFGKYESCRIPDPEVEDRFLG
ncbi:MAG: DUF393 domain-containing protein [Deltaproteobacteria bacterium]|nr:MAG: DUF393 domain-containing protein [Deltaproteobacteria bacterium]